MICLVTDNGAGFSEEEIKLLNLKILPLSFYIDGKEYITNDNMSGVDFFNLLDNSKEIKTSQLSISFIEDIFRDLLKEYDNVIYIPLISGLSSAYNTGVAVAREPEFMDKVIVIDAKKLSVLQKFTVYDCIKYINQNMNPIDIKNKIEQDVFNISIYIMVDTLEYLKKGGRISPVVATVVSLLHIKPILFSDGGPFDISKKERNIDNAKKAMLELIKKNIEKKFGNLSMSHYSLGIAYNENDAEALDLKNKALDMFGDFSREIPVDPLSRFICCHIGPNSLGIGIYKNID